MTNVLAEAPYADEGFGRRQVVNEKHLLIMQIALRPGQKVPLHPANSNVHLLVVDGEIVVNLNGLDQTAVCGDLVPVAFKTPMHIRNEGAANATFLVLKAPNPSEMTD